MTPTDARTWYDLAKDVGGWGIALGILALLAWQQWKERVKVTEQLTAQLMAFNESQRVQAISTTEALSSLRNAVLEQRGKR